MSDRDVAQLRRLICDAHERIRRLQFWLAVTAAAAAAAIAILSWELCEISDRIAW